MVINKYLWNESCKKRRIYRISLNLFCHLRIGKLIKEGKKIKRGNYFSLENKEGYHLFKEIYNYIIICILMKLMFLQSFTYRSQSNHSINLCEIAFPPQRTCCFINLDGESFTHVMAIRVVEFIKRGIQN